MKQRLQSIVILTPGFPANETEHYYALPSVQNLVGAIARRNPSVAVHVVSFHLPFERKDYRWRNATVYALGGRARRFPLRFRTWLQAARQVLRLTRSHEVIALHSLWLAECTYVASHLARLAGVRHIASILGQDALGSNPYLRRLPFDRMTITACSETAADAFYASVRRRVDHVIPIGLDPEARAAGRALHDDAIDILGVGSLTPVKDYASFLEVVAELRRALPDLRCMIVGDGPEREALEELVRKHGLGESVRFAGHLPREQVLRTMRRSRILLHTARYEGQGYVFLEALASGLWVVCREVGYTGDGVGVRRCRSTGEMVEAVRALLAAPTERPQVEVIGIEQTAAAFERIYGIGWP